MTPIKTSANLRFAVLAVDTLLLTYQDNQLFVRLIKVDLPPHYKNVGGLPGGLLGQQETAEQAARKHIINKTGIKSKALYLEQVYTFTTINRDPRNRVVAVAYLGLIPWESLTGSEKENTEQSWWCPINKLPKQLAYDHKEIIQIGLDRFRARITYSTLISHIMPKKFTLTELEEAYEDILHKKIDKRNFRKKMMRLKLVKKLSEKRTGLKARPAALYTFAKSEVMDMTVL